MLLSILAALALLVGVQASVAPNASSTFGPYPLQPTVNTAKANLAGLPNPTPTGLNKNDYLQSIAGIVGYERTRLQKTTGAIVDPYLGREVQYSTPTFAHGAIVAGMAQGDTDLINAGALALNWSLNAIAGGSCPDSHCNFFTLPIMLGIEALRPIISTSLYQWYLSQATKISTSVYINNDINWGLIAAAGEYVRYQYGLTTLTWLENEINTLMVDFDNNGQFMDLTPSTNPPMAYDIFPRLCFELMLWRNYTGKVSANMMELMNRGSLTSILLQSPIGEYARGGRSDQHNWIECAEMVIFEIRANLYKAAGDMVMAGAFKRAARLAHQAFRKWISEEGYIWILKNRMPPQLRWGYEIYSYQTNYNGWPASFLALAYQLADDTIPEGPSFAEIGGFVFGIPTHHKIIANVLGNYYEWDTYGDTSYTDSTGLQRVHYPNALTLIGPTSGGHIDKPVSICLGWTKGGVTEWLAQFGTPTMTPAYLNVSSQTPTSLSFTITYPLTASYANVTQVVETVVVSTTSISIKTSLNTKVDQINFMYPVFLFDGLYNSSFSVENNVVNMYGMLPLSYEVLGYVPQQYTVVNPTGVTLEFENINATTRNGIMGIATGSVPDTQAYYEINISHCAGCLPTKTFSVGPSGTYATISAALTAASAYSGQANIEISVAAGTYAENVVVATPNLNLRGSGSVLLYSSSGSPLTVTADNVKVYGLKVYSTVSQTNGPTNILTVNPGAALTKGISFYSCSFYGFQQTVSLTTYANVYFEDCYIEGGMDVIYGTGNAFFDDCTLASNGPGAYTAQYGKSASGTNQWVINYCTFYATLPNALIAAYANANSYSSVSLSVGANYLARTTDNYSRVTVQSSYLGTNINPAAWQGTGNFREFQNTGPNGVFGLLRATSAYLLDGDEAKSYLLENVFGGAPTWVDPMQFPTCGPIWNQCGGGSFGFSECCRAPYYCIEKSSNFSQCTPVSLYPRGTGVYSGMYTTGTLGNPTIYVNNPYGNVTFSYDPTNPNATFDAYYYNAVNMSVLADVYFQSTSFNFTVGYSSLSDPRGIHVDLHVTVPNKHITIVDVSSGTSSVHTNPPSPTTNVPFAPSSTLWSFSSAPSLASLLSWVVLAAALVAQL